MNATRRFLGDASTWGDASLALEDMHGLWGGRVIDIRGDGATDVRVYPVPQWERRYEFQLPPEEAQRLIELCIEHDLLSIAFPPRTRVYPDEARSTIHLVNAEGRKHSVACWAGDPRNADFEAVYAALRQVESHARQQQLLYEGPAQPPQLQPPATQPLTCQGAPSARMDAPLDPS